MGKNRELADALVAPWAPVGAPELVVPGCIAGEEWFLRSAVAPSRWLQVVVAFAAQDGHIVTAFGRRKSP